jgi:hypothetical protein
LADVAGSLRRNALLFAEDRISVRQDRRLGIFKNSEHRIYTGVRYDRRTLKRLKESSVRGKLRPAKQISSVKLEGELGIFE